MEIKIIKDKLLKTSMKGQLFTLTTLILFILMLSVLFSFVIINTQYYSQQQSIALSSGAINLVLPLNASSTVFGSTAERQALSVLAFYEYNSSLRHGNFISNQTLYLSYLLKNATLPNVQKGTTAASYLKVAMGNLTFYDYNQTLMKLYSQLGLQSINETNIAISQSSPYTLTLSYIENVVINQTGDISRYSFPITATINLTGMPDLLLAQQGIIRYIHPGNIQNLTSIITGGPAISGSLTGIAYDTILYDVNPTCPTYTLSQESSLILVTNTLSNSEYCTNDFAGFVLNITGFTSTGPYLIYSQNTILSRTFKTGQNILIYGPSLEALNIQNLISAVSNHYYFTSPFTPSYIERSINNLSSSTSGIFTFSGFNRLAGSFNGHNSYISITPSSNLQVPISSNGLSINTWILPSNTEASGTGILSTTPGCGYSIFLSNSNTLSGSDDCGDTYSGNYNFVPGVWYDLSLIVSNGAPSNIKLYVNGNQILSTTGTWGTGTSWSNLFIGSNPSSGFFNGSISNVQIYNSSLSQNSIKQLFQRGISGIPISNNGLVGWFTLNGNQKDLSGQNNNAFGSNVLYTSNLNGVPSVNVSMFNGASSFIQIPSTVFNFITSGTTTTYSESFSVWFKTTSDGVILGQESSPPVLQPTGYVPSIYVDTNGDIRASLFWHGSTADQIVTTTPYNNGKWHFLVDTYNNGQETLYIDGKQVGTQSQSEVSYSSTYYYQLGTGYTSVWPDSNGAWFYFNGELADAQARSSALSEQQILSMYASGITGAPPAPYNSTLGWWPLNGNINNYGYGINSGVSYPNNILYGSFNGSARDSALGTYSSSLEKIPGILSCINIFGCYNSNSSGIYLGNAPLEIGGKLQTAQFNSNSFITANIPLSGNFGVSFWLRLNASSLGTTQSPLSFSGTNGIIISSIGGLPTLGLTDGVNTLYANTIQAGSWEYVAATKSGSTYSIYLNNYPANIETMGQITINNLTLGRLSNGAEFFNGSLADLQIYSTTLTSSQVAQLYNGGIVGTPLTGNVVAWFPLTNNCYNYTSSQFNCYSYHNVTYPYFSGNYLAPNYPSQIVQNAWQALGFGTQPQ